LSIPIFASSEPIPYPNKAMPVPRAAISNPPRMILSLASLDLTAPITNDANRLVAIATSNGT